MAWAVVPVPIVACEPIVGWLVFGMELSGVNAGKFEGTSIVCAGVPELLSEALYPHPAMIKRNNKAAIDRKCFMVRTIWALKVLKFRDKNEGRLQTD